MGDDFYTIDAVATEYQGIAFRSQLEARWAHLFDQIDIPWEYEPVIVDGWMPDFRLWGKFLVEVKPVEPTGFAMVSHDWPLIKKAVHSYHTILLGNGPGRNFGCLASGDNECVGGMTIFYDPHKKYKMRTVRGDGGNDPQLGALEWHWRNADVAIPPIKRRSMQTGSRQTPTGRSKSKRRCLK